MPEQSNSERKDYGISGLPRNWAVAVQLISTFGLAVFLVLYYVLVLHPKETSRYDQLRSSVDSLIEVVEKQQTLLAREQSANLERLFVLALAPELADRVIQGLGEGISTKELAKRLEDALIVKTSLLQGLTRKDGGTISEMLTHKIRNSGIADKMAEQAKRNWSSADRMQIASNCRDSLEFAIRTAAMAK